MMDLIREFHGPNAGYVLELYDRYRADPQSVDADTRAFFDRWQPPVEIGTPFGPQPFNGLLDLDKIVAVANLAQSIRTYGHLAAHLDPLGTPPPADPSLDPASFGLSEQDLRSLPASLVGGPVASQVSSAWDAIGALKKI
jgi:2-oxoglutarate dehydrogenase E1 component